MISVIVSTYCRSRSISTALDSILNQTFTDFELIILDDGSIDGTKEIIESYAIKDKRIRWLRFDENSGVPAKRYNQGISLAKGEYIAFMFDDDLWYPHALKTLHDFFIQNRECGMVYGLCDYDMRGKGNITKNFGAEWDYKRLVEQGNFLGNLTVLIRKNILNEIGAHDEDPIIRRLCDWDLWVRIGASYSVKRIAVSVGMVHGGQPDSVGATMPLDIEKIRNHQQNKKRPILLKNYWSAKKKIIFVTHGHDAGLQRWRIDYLMKSINELNTGWIASKVDKNINCRDLENADVIVLYRFMFPDSYIKGLLKKGKTLVYDIDDYTFEENGKYNTPSVRKQALEWMQDADLVTVSTHHLKTKLEDSDKGYVRRNAIPIKEFRKFLPRNINKNLRIGWLNAGHKYDSNEFVISLLQKICVKSKITLIYFGNTEEFYRELTEIGNLTIERRQPIPWDKDKEYYQTLQSADLDCIINPLPHGEFIDCKSELKFIECGILGIPLITSPRNVFREIIKTNGILAESIEDFEKAINGLKDKYIEIVNKAYDDVSTFYNIDHIRDEFIVKLDSILGDKIEYETKVNKVTGLTNLPKKLRRIDLIKLEKLEREKQRILSKY